MKTCTRCSTTQPIDDFHRASKSPDGRRSACKKCTLQYRKSWALANPERMAKYARERFVSQEDHRRSNLWSTYRMTPEGFASRLADQGGVCAGCLQPATKTLHIDHDHGCCPGKKSCGRCIRALLCGSCNIGLGHLADSPSTLRRLADIVESFAADNSRRLGEMSS